MIKKKILLNKCFSDALVFFEKNKKARNIISSASREILVMSKENIYAVQRKDFEKAKKNLIKIESKIKKLKSSFKSSELSKNNMYKNALQEFVEAKCFYEFIINRNIPTFKSLKVDPYNYLAGLSDFTGELARFAVLSATNHQYKIIKEIREAIDYLLGQMMLFNFSNGELRKKYDAVKWNLNKVEGILYDISLKKKK